MDILEVSYIPHEGEEFMNERQQAYFKERLLHWKEEILQEMKGTMVDLQEQNLNHPDSIDRATSEFSRSVELRSRDRQRKLISKIDAALIRLQKGTYGYCEETGEPIGLQRLIARPVATLSIAAQEEHERKERVYRDE